MKIIRDSFIGTWVSKQEKEEVVNLAKGMNISVSDLIRHRVIRPMMTLPEAIQNLRLHIDSKIKKIEHKITESFKDQQFMRPTRRTYIEEYEPIEPIARPPPKLDITNAEQLQMREVLAEMKKLVRDGELILEIVPEEEIEKKRPKTDQVAFIEWKSKKK